MDVMNIFAGDAFGAISLTNEINKQPYPPRRIGSMGLYDVEAIGTATASIHERFGRIRMIETSARGEMSQFRTDDKSRLRQFAVPHLELGDALYADDLINARLYGEQIGSGPSPNAVAQAFARKSEGLKKDHEVTWEYMRLASIKGVLVDADGTTEIYNWFDEFGISKKEVTWTTATQPLSEVCREIKRHIVQTLGSMNNDGNVNIHCFVGATFMDAVADDSTVKSDYQRWMDGERNYGMNAAYDQFRYQGITFEEYLGTFEDGTPFVADDKGHAFPLGTDRFKRYNAPADTIDAAGTMGLPLYMHQEPKKGNKGIDIYTQSNPLFICAQPGVLVELTLA